MKLYHCGASGNFHVNEDSRYGEFLFFSREPNPVLLRLGRKLYSVEIDDGYTVTAKDLFDAACDELHEEVARCSSDYGIDEAAALAFLSDAETASSMVYDATSDNDKSVDAYADSHYRAARCARDFGFKALRVENEWGETFIIDPRKLGFTKTSGFTVQ